jgi:hypothetical protein
MAENPDEAAGDCEKAQSDAAKPDESKAMTSNLPMVVAPKLGAGEDVEDEAVDEALGATAEETAAPADSSTPTAAPVRSSRFVALAASVAFAAAFGSFIGSVSGSGLARFIYPAAAPASGTDGVNEALRTMKQQLGELSALKVSLETASRSTTSQFAKISDRLDHIDQRAAAAPDTTGSITASPPAAEPVKLTDRVLQDWIVQDVQNGRALVENRYGGIFDVGAGSTLPGVGRIETVKRQDGQWIVVTARGLITSGR